MGSSSSKAAGKAATPASRRRYPATSSILNNATPTANAPASQTAGPGAVRPNPREAPPAEHRSAHIDLDGRDPQFSSKLRALGPAMPVVQARPQDGAFPTSSQPPLGTQAGGQEIFPSTGTGTNPALVIVKARERIARVWEAEQDALGRGSFAGRTMLSAGELAEVVQLRNEGVAGEEIEKRMRLSRGLVGRLGLGGVIT